MSDPRPRGARRTVPIIADEAVERDFGTGALKITPGHDPVDFEARPAAPHLLGLHSPTAD